MMMHMRSLISMENQLQINGHMRRSLPLTNLSMDSILWCVYPSNTEFLLKSVVPMENRSASLLDADKSVSLELFSTFGRCSHIHCIDQRTSSPESEYAFLFIEIQLQKRIMTS